MAQPVCPSGPRENDTFKTVNLLFLFTASFFIWRQVGLDKVHPCAEFGVASSKFTFTGGPHVKTSSSPLARAAGTPQERHPQWILRWYSMRVTCEFGVGGAAHVTCRCVRFFCRPSRGGTCHVPRAADRPKTDTIIVPVDRRVEWCLAGLDRTSRSNAIPGNAWTHKQHS